MLRIIRHALVGAAALALLLIAVVGTLPLWFPSVLAALLPPGWRLDPVAVVTNPWRAPAIDDLALSVSGCRLLALQRARADLAWRWPLPAIETVAVDAVTVDPACLDLAPPSAAGPGGLPDWLAAAFAGTRLTIDRLAVAGWVPQPHRLTATVGEAAAQLAIEGPALHLAGRWEPGTRTGSLAGEVTLERLLPVEGLAVSGLQTVEATLALPVAAGAQLQLAVSGRAVVTAEGPDLDLRNDLRLGWRDGVADLRIERLVVAPVATASTDTVAAALAAEAVLAELHGSLRVAPGAGGAVGEAVAPTALAGQVNLRSPGRVELDMDLSGTLRRDPARPPAGQLAASLRGRLPATRSRLDGEVAGGWEAGTLTIGRLGLGLDQLATPALTVLRPRVDLDGPAQLDTVTGRLSGKARLAAERLNLAAAGRLEGPQLDLAVEGARGDLAWSARGTATGGVGPVSGEGRWTEAGLSGRLTLARQAVTALQGLLAPTLPIELQGGEAAGEATLSWSGKTDAAPIVEGDLSVSKAQLGWTHGAASGIDVRLPFRYADGVWQIGPGRAAQLAAAQVTAAVPAAAARARVAGSWPWSARRPLRVEGVQFRILGGEATLDALRLPQRGRPATLRLRGIRLEQVSALHGDEVVSLSGAVDADLPLHLDHGTLLVEGGTLRNASPVRLRLTDAEAIAAFKANNPNLAQAADWLSDLHVDRLDGTLDLRRDGELVLAATVEGRNPQRGDRPVRLNYRHEENLLQLLQSLRIGSDLSRDIEQRLSPPPRRPQ